jgi:hypothetical protein
MRVLETALTATLGALLGWLAGWPLDLGIWTAAVAALNGGLSGFHRIYPWKTGTGWAGFVLDSTWGLIGTAASLLFHLVQLVMPSGRYREELSTRRGRHVYDGGYRIKPGFATAIGNVITNAGGTAGLDGAGGPRRRLLVDRHEMLHVWQHRWFGPLFPVLYTAWALIAGLIGIVVAVATKRPIGKSVVTLAYFDNPFEYWAYRRDRYWPPGGADPGLAWKGSIREDTVL